jgi:hypothetical protein
MDKAKLKAGKRNKHKQTIKKNTSQQHISTALQGWHHSVEERQAGPLQLHLHVSGSPD